MSGEKGPVLNGIVEEEDNIEMLECARYGEVDDLKFMLENGCDVNYVDDLGNSALHKASANGNLEIAEILLNYNIKYVANKSGNFPLHYAALGNHIEIAKFLMAKFDEVNIYARNSFGTSAFTEAVNRNYEDLARLMLEHKSADPGDLRTGDAVVEGEEDDNSDYEELFENEGETIDDSTNASESMNQD